MAITMRTIAAVDMNILPKENNFRYINRTAMAESGTNLSSSILATSETQITKFNNNETISIKFQNDIK